MGKIAGRMAKMVGMDETAALKNANGANVYNCRCTISAKVIGFKKVSANVSANPLTPSRGSGIIEGVYRKTSNTGAFSHLPKRMSKKNIRAVAKEAGIDLKGITINIEQSEEWLRSPFTGRADPNKIGSITLFPNAFSNKEELVRTVCHEKIHVQQFRKHGAEFVQNNKSKFEEEAYSKEDAFTKKLKDKGII